jgi:flavorubredoxin
LIQSAVKVKTKVRSVGVAPDTVLIQNIDDELTRFEIEYKAGKGSTVNTYLIKVTILLRYDTIGKTCATQQQLYHRTVPPS